MKISVTIDETNFNITKFVM